MSVPERLCAALWLLLLLLLPGGCTHQAPAPAPVLAGTLELRAPAQVAAGTPLSVWVLRADAPDGLVANLVLQGSYGATLYRAPFQSGQAEFRLPGSATRSAGFVTLSAGAGAARGQAELAITPGAPADPITPLVGPRSIIADGRHWGSIVAIPFDGYGNPVAAGTPVTFTIQHPGAPVEVISVPVQHLVAWSRLVSATRAGRTLVSAVAGAAHGPEADLLETPGWPGPFTLSASPPTLPADGRRLLTLRTSSVRDRFGNALLDGTLVTFVAEMPGERPRFIPAYTLDGVAEAQLQAPLSPGVMTVRATLYGVESAPLRISFTSGPAVGNISLNIEVLPDKGLVIIETGPLLGPLGQFVPDNTPVFFQVTGPSAMVQRLEGVVHTGRSRVELRLAELAPGNYNVAARLGSGSGQAGFRVP